MKILFVIPYLPSLIRVRSYHFLRELSRDHQVTLLATDWPRRLENAGKLREFCRAVHLVQLRKSDIVRSCAGAAVRGEPLQAAFCRSGELDRAFRGLVQSHHFDLVHIEHLRAGHLVWSAPTNLPCVYDSVDCISLLLERTRRSSHSLLQRVLATMELGRVRQYEARLLDRCDGVAITAPGDREALQALAPRARIALVPTGVDLDYFSPREDAREPVTLLFSGKMSYHANVTALLHFARDIFPLIRRDHPEVRLLVAGSDPPPSVRRLASDPAITVTGYLSDLRGTMSRATVVVAPMVVQVGLQNKLLEAMAMGLPVVATPRTIQGLAVEEERELLTADTPPEFAAQVCRLLTDRPLRDRLGRNGRRYVEQHHRWDVAAQRLTALYAEAMDSHRPHLPAGVSS